MNPFAPIEITVPGRYEAILAEWRAGELRHLVAHFPDHIPPNARDVRFFGNGGWLGQGEPRIQFRYAAPPQRIAELYARFSKQQTRSCRGGNARPPEDMPICDFYTATPGVDSGPVPRWYPEDYEVILLSRPQRKRSYADLIEGHGPTLRLKSPPRGRDCEQYERSVEGWGVAISKKTNVIVYWETRY